MPVTQGKDTMYGGRPNPPAASPNAAFISSPIISPFQLKSQTGMIPGGTIQLFIRQWNGGVGQPALFQCWDGSTVWQWNKNGTSQWDIIATGQTYWSSPAFQLGPGNQWSIIPQTGTANQPGTSFDQSFNCGIQTAPPIGPNTQLTFQNVNNGMGGSTNIVVTVDIEQVFK